MAMSLVMGGRPQSGERGCNFKVRLGTGKSRPCNRRVHRNGRCLRHDPQRIQESLESNAAQRREERAQPRPAER